VAEGQAVAQGQLLARVDQTAVRDGVAQAEAALAQARAEETAAATKLERAQRAFQAGVAAGQEVDDARAQAAAAQSGVKTAQAAVSTAGNQVARSELRAPFAGVVAQVFAAQGEPVEGNGKPILEVADPRQLELRARVAPAEAARIHAGAPAEVEAPGGRRGGTVVAVAPTVDTATGTVAVRVRVENADGALKVGAAGKARVVLAVRAGALVVPRVALVPLDQESSRAGARALAVEWVGPDGAVTRKAVTVGVEAPGAVEILSGLGEGDTVVTEGAYALPDGTRVRPRAPADGGP
jgi:HlyD family secretion protein